MTGSMTRSTHRLLLLALLPVLALGVAAGAGAAPTDDLGSIDFPATGSETARPHFERGVLLLHSFEFEDAREAFQRARAIDPDFVMAAWGEAMTYNHPLWREQDREAARRVLAEIAPTPEARALRAPTEREKRWIGTLEVLYSEEGSKLERDLAYEAAMAALAADYSRDLEARAFWALSILGSTQGERDFRAYMRAAAVAEEVFAANPRHPGAVHYMIHSYDDPIHAPLGLRAARVYARIAPAATHAQHMVSHIFIALGDWRASAEANEKAVRVSEERARRKGLPEHRRNHHALHWLHYSYLQMGRVADAAGLLATMTRDAAAAPDGTNLWYQAFMRAGQVVDGGDRGLALAPLEAELDSIAAIAADLYAVALTAVERGDTERAEALGDRLDEAIAAAGARQESGTDDEGWDESPADLEAARATAHLLRSLVASRRGEVDTAVAEAERGAEIEDAMRLEYGPPLLVQPAAELHGWMLLRAETPAEAQQAFARSLLRYPRRASSLAGLAQAARGAGDNATADRAMAELADVRSGADSGS